MTEFNPVDESEAKKGSPAESIKFCPQCGKGITHLTKFCPNCGHSLEKSADQSKSEPSSQHRVAEDDFIAFIGNHAGYYVHVFKKFESSGEDTFSLTWNWAAFWGGFGWLLYRKMYMWAIIAFCLMFMPYLGLASWIALGAVANYLYYQHAKSKILAIRALHQSEDVSIILAQTGRVHKWLPIAAVIVTILLLLLFMALIFWSPFGISDLFNMPSQYI